MAPNLEKMEQYQLLVKLDNAEDCQILLEDLCTRMEMKKWQIGSTPTSC